MNRQRIALALTVWLMPLVLTAVPAQDQRPQQAQMYEDVEILRRLLVRKLDAWHPASGRHTGTSSGSPFGGFSSRGFSGGPSGFGEGGFGGDRGFGGSGFGSGTGFGGGFGGGRGPALADRDVEGVYLKGQGVILTLTLPPLGRDPRPETAKPTGKPLSDWDRIRKELRNEKAEPGDVPERKEPALADVILKVLADNGKHFAQLGDNESITVVTTFRHAEHAGGGHRGGSPDGGGGYGRPPGGGDGGPAGIPGGTPGRGPGSPDGGVPSPGGVPDPGEAGGLPPGSGTPDGTGSPEGSGVPKRPSSARDYELLGDLHLNQGDASKALDQYTRALELKPDGRQTAALCAKIAQAYLAQRDLDRAADWVKRAKEEADKASKPAPAPSPLPAKLIVSAPKKLLDQVGAGKISFEEFKKAATVEYLTFPAEKKAPK